MKIAILADIHLVHLKNPKNAVKALREWLVSNLIDVICIAGDIAEIALLKKNSALKKEKILKDFLNIHDKTLFVLGNHDLWSSKEICGLVLSPEDAMERHLKTYFKWGTPLEKSWTDKETVLKIGDISFVGCMGFPDFQHPIFKIYEAMLNRGGTTNDIHYMKIQPLGWLHYTNSMQEAFSSRLNIAVSDPNTKTVVIITHYGIFEQQTRVNRDDVSPYFFNYTMGRMIVKVAAEHPGKTFICISGHSHEYCVGELRMAFPNVYCYGHINNYKQLSIRTMEIVDGNVQLTNSEMLYKEGF